MSGFRSVPDRLARHVRDLPRSGIRDFFEIVSTRRDVISLGIGEPDFVTPWHIREASIYALDHGRTSYTANLGMIECRRAVAAYVTGAYGVTYDAATEVLITVGVSEALDLAIRALVDPGDEVLYHEPCYVSYSPVVTMAHGVPVPVVTRAEEGFRLTRAMLEAKVSARTKVLLLNFPCNPTGAVLRPAEVAEIAQFAIAHDLLVITDDIYSELTYEGERASIAACPGLRERTIFLNGCSKAWAMTGFRLGFACAPPPLVEAMMKIHQYTMLCTPILSQLAAIEALKAGAVDVATMRDEYRRRRNFIHGAFGQMGLPCSLPEGAFYAFPCVAGCGLPSRDFALRLLDEENVACVPGSAFGACGEGFLRCSYATDMDDIQEAMRRLARFVKRLRG